MRIVGGAMGELTDKIKGKANQVKGDLTGNEADKIKGKAQELSGEAKGKFEEAKTDLKRALREEDEVEQPQP